MKFGNKGREADSLQVDQAKLMFENIKELDCSAFATDEELFKDLSLFQVVSNPLGIVLTSDNNSYLACGSKLLPRKDRPSQVIVYHDIMGSLPGSHYYKYCKSRPCGFIQYYGYCTKGGSSFVYFNPNWKTFPYFLSSKETAF